MPDEAILQLERSVLQALCQGTPEGNLWETAGLILKDYHWREPLHEVIFRILVGLPTDSTEVIRQRLPSHLTRRGFPDVDWEQLFEPHHLSTEQVERLMKRLRDMG